MKQTTITRALCRNCANCVTNRRRNVRLPRFRRHAAGRPQCVLHELRVENLLLIERAELFLGSGLNVLTGETGAGKTVLAHALDLLLGGKPRSGIVRPGAAEAYVEGVFALPDAVREALGDRLASDAEELVLARRVSAEGRTRAYLGGRSATAADLREAGTALLSFYGQHEARKLMLASAQLQILDGFAGPEQAARRETLPGDLRPRARLVRAARRAARTGRCARPRAGPAGVGARGDRPGGSERGGRGRAGRRARAVAARRGAALLGRDGRRSAGGRRGGRRRCVARARRGGAHARVRGRRGRRAGRAGGAGPRALAGGRGPGPRAAPLRRGHRRRSGPPGRGRGAARAAGPAQAQARGLDRRGARARGRLPGAARRAGGRRGGDRGRRRRARGRAGRAGRARRRAAGRPRNGRRGAGAGRRRAPRGAGDGRRRVHRRAVAARRASARPAATRSSS